MSSRTENSIKNVKFGILLQFSNIILRFAVRTVFVYSLGPKYLGIGSVFNNIFSILSLAELGIGTAIAYDMYKPVSINDTYKIKQLLDFYRKFYYGIGGLIIAAGVCILPFLDFILSDVHDVENITLIFILHIIYSSSSYFFAHYRSLFSAYQLERINSSNTMFFSYFQTGGEMIALITTHSYISYMLIQIICTIFSNYILRIKAKRRFELINTKVKPLSKSEIKGIMSNAMSMLSIKIGQTVITSTDNLVISALLSTVLVGIYGNYSMIISVLLSTTFVLENSVMASIGNLCTDNNDVQKYSVFKKIRCGYSCLYGVMCSCLVALLNPFIELWLGRKYLLSFYIVILVVLNFYLLGIRQPLEAYIYADGLFRHFRVKPWAEAIINLTVSIVLAQNLGIAGVFMGTAISHFLTTFWFDAYIVYKYSFGKKLVEYMKLYLVNITWTVISVAVSCVLFNYIYDRTILSFILSVMAVFIASVGICYIFNCRNDEFNELRKRLLKGKN